MPRQDAVELGQEEGDRPVGAEVLGAVDVAFQQVLDLLLPPPPLGRVGRALGVEAEQDGVAVGEELLDRLVGAERDVLALVILDDQLEPRGAVVEAELQLGLGQRAGHGLARLDLGDLLGQVLGAMRRRPRPAAAPAPGPPTPGDRTSPGAWSCPRSGGRTARSASARSAGLPGRRVGSSGGLASRPSCQPPSLRI